MSKEDMLSYEQENQSIYDDLKNKASSPFKNKNYAYIFIYAIAFALYKDISPIKIKSKNPNIPLSAFKEDFWLINALALKKKGTYKILFDKKELYSLAEEYANAGIKPLYDEIFNKSGDFYKKIELWLKKDE